MPVTKYILFFVFAITFSIGGGAQTKAQKKQVRQLLRESKFYLNGADYLMVWFTSRQVLAIDSMNETAGLNAAIALDKLQYHGDSSVLLLNNLSASSLGESKFYLAQVLHRHKKFDEAMAMVDAYLKSDSKNKLHKKEEVNNLLNMCRNAKTFIASPHRSTINNIGNAVNSKYDDYVPVIIPDESVLYFTSKRKGEKNGDNSFYEDVYVSYKKEGAWTPAENIGFPINSETNDACVAISPDGQRMIVYRTAADKLTGDLYLTRAGKNRWEALEKIGPEINSEFIETSACFSNDTSEIYFSSDRPGGLGGKDIYRIKKLPNGHWSVPYNLGSKINTPSDEDSPFLHPDGVSLYFSSKGHNTMGDYDIFKAVLNTDDNQFSDVENLGYPINDVGSDIFFVLSVDGKRGYYSSIKEETYGGVDIYQIDTRFGDNDLVVALGKVLLEGVPGRVKITVTEKETQQVNGHYFSYPENGKFILVLNPLKSYHATIEEDGYNTFDIDIPALKLGEEYRLKWRLTKSNAQ